MQKMRSGIFGLLSLGFTAICFGADNPAPEYSKDIAPILRKYCAGCHNADEREGKLSIETFAEMQKGGEHGPAILPGDSKSSRLIRVLVGESKPAMPPEDNDAPSEAEIELLKAWIDAGAKGPDAAEPNRNTLIVPKIKPPANVDPAITAIDWSPDGKLLAIARFGNVELLDTKTQKSEKTIKGFPGKVNSVEFSADGQHLVTASGVVGLYGEAAIWNVSDGSLVRKFSGHRDTLYDATPSPNGGTLATCGYDRRIILWDTASGTQLRSLSGHNGAVYDLAFSPDGTVLASASADETVKLWKVADGLRLDTLGQPTEEQYVVTFSPDGRFVLAGGADNRIRVWRFVSKKRQRD